MTRRDAEEIGPWGNASISRVNRKEVNGTDQGTALLLEGEPGDSNISEDEKACAFFLGASLTTGASVTTCQLASISQNFIFSSD